MSIPGDRMKKVVVCGPYNAGKTTFVRNINEGEFLGTDEPEIDISSLQELGTTTTVGVEVNFLKIGNKEVMFVGVPGQSRFDFIWEIIGGHFDGIIFMIPSFSTLKEANVYINSFSKLKPYKNAYKLLLITYPNRVDEIKLTSFKSLGIPLKLIDPTNKTAVKKLAIEVASKV